MRPIRPVAVFLSLLAFFALLSFPAHSEKGDREKPINIEADRFSMDDVKKVQVFDGNVILTQGTTQLHTGKLVVTQDADGFQIGVATGGPNGLARFRQKRDGKDDYIEGEAEKIVHNARDEKTEFFVRAWIKSGQDEVRGHYISYEALTEKYLVTNSGETQAATGATQARVRAVIQPRGKPAPEEDQTDPAVLKPATELSPR